MIALLAILIAALSAGPAAAQAPEPEEPDIVLPEVILRIEDFSVESVDSTLPAEEAALPPARELPLPDPGELAVSEPQLPLAVEEPAEPASKAAGKAQTLSALVELGAGSMNHLLSRVSLFRQGDDPRFRLRFVHETLDGLSGEPSGSGFNLRQDSLEGALKLRLSSLRLDTQGELREEERGLQGQPSPAPPTPFVSRVFRRGGVAAELAWPMGSHWTLAGAVDSSFAAQLLTGAAPQGLTEILAAPKLSVELRYPKYWASLAGRYAYRDFLEGGREAVNRAGVEAGFGVDPLAGLHLEARGGWLWGNLLGHRFPFSLSLSAVPSPVFSLNLEGGYRVEQIDARNLLDNFPWGELPVTILDDHGWYTDLGLGFTLKRALSVQAGTHLAWHSAQPSPPPTPIQDARTGLYPLDQVSAVRLAVEAALRWTPARQTFLAASWRMQLLDRLTFEPTTEVRLDGEAATSSGRWGGRGSLVFRIGYAPEVPAYTLVPELSLGVFYKASEAISLVLEGEDLLSPLADGGDRWSWYPFVEPGIRGTFKVQINL
jgi:hypothetical protein